MFNKTSPFKPTLERLALILLFIASGVFTACMPTASPASEPISTPTPEEPAVQPPAMPDPGDPVLGCADGGEGVFSPEDVRCYLATFDPQFVRELDGETAVLFSDPTSIADWVGGATIYHIPTVSTLVLDRFGDVDPLFSHFASRAGMAALSELIGDPSLMAELQQEVQQHWQTSSPGEPEIRLSAAWQDGQSTIFLVAIAGLAADDGRFYCAGEAWTIGDETTEIAYDCIALEAGDLIQHAFFAAQEIRGSAEQPVQVALNRFPSNVVMVKEGEMAVETAVYQALISHTGSATLILRGETLPADPDAATLLTGTAAPDLLANFLAINQTSISLRFLFQNSHVANVQPSSVIARDYLPLTGADPDCATFRSSYPGLSGVISVSQIGYNPDNTQALVFMELECGHAPWPGSYFLLTQTEGKWQVTQARVGLPPSDPPRLDYSGAANGCGDIFVYKPNGNDSEFVTFSIAASEFDLSTEPLALNLAETGENVVAKIDLYADRVQNLGEFPYCNDVGPQAVPQSEWLAVSGAAVVAVSEGAQTTSCEGALYQTTVRLENVTFRNGAAEVYLESVMFDGVTVGWCAG